MPTGTIARYADAVQTDAGADPVPCHSLERFAYCDKFLSLSA